MKNGHALVSVIVPIYNVERYLARCLDSILSQTYGNLQIICVNDGATDGSRDILARYADKDDRIVVIDRINGGLSAARNSGLNAVEGDWVMFVDSDDWIPPYAVERFLKVAEESNAKVVVSRNYLVEEANATTVTPCDCAHWTLEAPALQRLVGNRKMQSSVCNKMYSAFILKNRRFIEGIYFEDWPYVTCLFGDLDSFALVDASMYVYCKNGESTVRSAFTEKKIASYCTGISYVAEYFQGHPMRKYAMCRIATAVKMLVGKAWKSGDDELRKTVSKGVCDLVKRGEIDLRYVDLKTRFRLWLIRKKI